MKILVAVAFVAIVAVSAKYKAKRAAYELPDGADLIVGPIRTTFQCPNKYGYYADVDNDCKIFHVCHPITNADGSQELQHFSFFCGNQTVFNQLTLTCAFEEEAVPCNNAPDFFYVNDNIGIPDAPFLTDADVERAAPLIPGFGSRKQSKAKAKA